ncbi:MAG: hypothetical protein IJB64_03110 [Akkermansia sp.]|nr:hypothetical protein [Akkermansia sp.]
MKDVLLKTPDSIRLVSVPSIIRLSGYFALPHQLIFSPDWNFELWVTSDAAAIAGDVANTAIIASTARLRAIGKCNFMILFWLNENGEVRG